MQNPFNSFFSFSSCIQSHCVFSHNLSLIDGARGFIRGCFIFFLFLEPYPGPSLPGSQLSFPLIYFSSNNSNERKIQLSPWHPVQCESTHSSNSALTTPSLPPLHPAPPLCHLHQQQQRDLVEPDVQRPPQPFFPMRPKDEMTNEERGAAPFAAQLGSK